MTISLIISTYNRPDALKVVLDSVMEQTVLPYEVIVGDDGSNNKTKELIEQYRKSFPVPLIHVWQEDRGFRLARIRNLAIKRAKGDYIISIDGDIVLHKEYINSHKTYSKKGYFLQGHRVLLNDTMTNRIIESGKRDISFWDFNLKNRKNTIHNFKLSKLFSTSSVKIKGIKGGIFSFWKSDALKVNGLNEEFVGWGKEDSEFAVRLVNSGIKRFDLRFCAVCYHLDHGKSNKFYNRNEYEKNLQLLNKSKLEKAVFCENGIDKL